MLNRKICLITLAVFAGFISNAAYKTYLVKSGVVKARICVPEKFSYATKLAIDELQAYFKKMTGSDIEFQNSPYDRKLFRKIRRTAFILAPENIGEYTGGKDRDNFEIIHGTMTLIIRSKSEEGVLFGVYTYLQELGVRWYSPGEKGEYVPTLKTIPIETGKVVKGAPSFWDRNIWYNGDKRWHINKTGYWEKQFNEWYLWCLRNRMDSVKKMRYSYYRNIAPSRIHNNHYISRAALQGVDINEHPERFAFYKNRKSDKRFPTAVKVKGGYRIKTDNICMTDPENIKQAIAHSIDYLKKNPELMIAPMSLGDFSGVCECEKCRAANNGIDPGLDPNTVVWKFMNKVSEAVDKVMPGKGVGFYACYGQMTHPPNGMKAAPTGLAVVTHCSCNAHALDDKNCIYNEYLIGNLRKIQKSGSDIKIRAYTMWPGRLQPLAILESIKAFYNTGARTYSCELMGRDELRNITQWCMAQLLWDASKDPGKLLQEYTSKYYGKAGSDVLKIMLMMDKQVRTCQHIVFDTYFDILSLELISECRKILKNARKKVKGDYSLRLDNFGKSLEYNFKRNIFYRSYVRACQERTPASVKEAQKEFSGFMKYYGENNLKDICSSCAVDWMQGAGKKLDKFEYKVNPAARKDIAKGGRKERIEALFTNADMPDNTENIILLPDVWKYSNDINRKGVKEGWFKIDFDDSKWIDLSVFNFISHQKIGHSPHFWYRTEFDSPVITKGKRLFMRIGSLDDEGTIYINGKKVYQRHHLKPNDWKTSFEFDITNVLKPGKQNTVAIHGIDHQGAAGLWRGVGIYTK